MSYEFMPEKTSYADLLKVLLHRPTYEMNNDELLYYVELIRDLRELQEKTDTESWWKRFYTS